MPAPITLETLLAVQRRLAANVPVDRLSALIDGLIKAQIASTIHANVRRFCPQDSVSMFLNEGPSKSASDSSRPAGR